MFVRCKSQLSHQYRRVRSYLGKPKLVHQTKPVILSDENVCENPVFLIGIHRSGTSLIRRIINSHSNIACPPETFFLEHFSQILRDHNTYAGLRGVGVDELDVPREIGRWASRHHEAFRLAEGKSRWADKTPQYIGILPEISEMFGDRTQYIMIFRHPLDVVYSIFNRGWSFGEYDSDPLVSTAKYVKDSLYKQMSFIEKNSDKCFHLKYESLMKDPVAVLKAVCAFLNEPWEPSLLKFNDFNHGFGTEDPIVRGTCGFAPSHDNWKSLKHEQLDLILPHLEAVAEELGYSYVTKQAIAS